MRILYLDLNAPDLIEDYSRDNPARYGGGRIVAAHLMPYMNDNGHYMEIWADERCFENVDEKYKKFCRGLEHSVRLSFTESKTIENFDVVLHNFGNKHVNCNGKSLIWLVGVNEWIHPANEYVILYNDFQRPRFTSHKKIFKARIGVPMPEFQEYQKEPFIFSCHRQAREFGSETMMQLAHKYKFKYIAAGPIDTNFPNIKDYVDDFYVSYLGVIDAKTKIDHFKRALCSTYLHSWPTPFNLSACEALSYGTPIIANNVGFWHSLIKNHENGFLVSSEQEFVTALQNIPLISRKSCYNSVLDYSSDLMIQDYMKIFNEILT